MRNGTLYTAGAALFILLTTSSVADAQSREMFELEAIQVTAFQNPLHSRAIEHYETPERWEQAGEMHELAAKQLARYDAGRFYGYRQASILYFHADKTARSRKAMEKAADVAEKTGDIHTAAHTWVDAAFLAVAEGFPGKKRELVRNAKSLADSELLSEEDRLAILARIDGTDIPAEAARIAMGRRLSAPLNLTLSD